jgi:hypothetical protein
MIDEIFRLFNTSPLAEVKAKTGTPWKLDTASLDDGGQGRSPAQPTGIFAQGQRLRFPARRPSFRQQLVLVCP